MERRRNEAGLWQLSWLQIAGIVMVAAGLVVTPIVVVTTRSTETRSSEAPSSVATSPASGGGASGVASGVEPATSVAVDAVALEPTGRVVAASATTLAEDGIVVEVVEAPADEVAGPSMSGAPEFGVLTSFQGQVMLRVRWAPAVGDVSSYRVVCDKVADPAPEFREALDVLRGSLAVIGVSLGVPRLEATTSETHVYFNNTLPMPGAEYRCSVTPVGLAAVGNAVSANVVVLPAGTSQLLSQVGSAAITNIVQVHGLLAVEVTRVDGPSDGDRWVGIRCVDIATGERLVGGSYGPFVTSTTGIVGGVRIGHQYDCTAAAPNFSATATVRSPVIVAQGVGVPGAPESVLVNTAGYGVWSLLVDLPSGLPDGALVGVVADCVQVDSGVSKRLYGGGAVDAANPSQAMWLGVNGSNVASGGLWSCAAAVVNEFGIGPTTSVTFAVSDPLPRPTGFRFERLDDGIATFSTVIASRVWDVAESVDVVVVCVDPATSAQVFQVFPLASLSPQAGGAIEVSLPLAAGTAYQCEYAVSQSSGQSVSEIGVYEFTTPAASGLASLGVAPLVEAPVVSSDEPAEAPAEVATIDPGPDEGATGVGGDADAPGDAPEASPTPTEGDDEGGDAGASDPATLPTEPEVLGGDA